MDEPIIDPAATPDPAAAPDAGTPTPDTSVPDATGTTTPIAEPSELEAYLAEQLKEETPDPAATPDPNAAPVVPEEFKAALSTSPYVTTPEAVIHAVKSSTELWDVMNGKTPIGPMLEGMETNSPAGFNNIVGGFIKWVEERTGKQFGEGAAPQLTPEQIVDQKVSAIEQKWAQERQQQAYTQTMNQVAPVFKKAIGETLGKQFGEGDEAYFIDRISKIVPEAKMVEALAKGDMKPLEAAMKQVKTEELSRFKRWSEHIIKQSKDFRKSLPAAKGGTVNTPVPSKFDMSTTEGRLAYANAAFNGDI